MLFVVIFSHMQINIRGQWWHEDNVIVIFFATKNDNDTIIVFFATIRPQHNDDVHFFALGKQRKRMTMTRQWCCLRFLCSKKKYKKIRKMTTPLSFFSLLQYHNIMTTSRVITCCHLLAPTKLHKRRTMTQQRCHRHLLHNQKKEKKMMTMLSCCLLCNRTTT